MIKYSHVVWDFNGTILNDVETGIRSVNALLERRGMKLLQEINDYQNIFTFPVIEYYRRLGFDFTIENYDDIAVEWVKEYHNNYKYAYINSGVADVIKKLNQLKIPQIILSASEIGMLTKQLTELGIIDYFDEILGLDNIKAGSKIEIANDWIRRVNPKKAILIGDTVHDFETAKHVGIDCILINGGHQNRVALMKCGVPVLDDIFDIFEFVVYPDIDFSS